MELTRRHILAGSAGLAAAPLLPAITANAAAPMADKQAPSFYRYKVGDVQVTVISDGVNTFPLGDSFVLNAKKDEVAAALEKAYMPKDKVSIQFGPLVINSGGKLIVLDTGNGPGAFASSKGAVGQFASNMAAAGFDPKNVDMVVISHFHGDHINGLRSPTPKCWCRPSSGNTSWTTAKWPSRPASACRACSRMPAACSRPGSRRR
jgi:hypothetical protein